jgi:hypothetical protein
MGEPAESGLQFGGRFVRLARGPHQVNGQGDGTDGDKQNQRGTPMAFAWCLICAAGVHGVHLGGSVSAVIWGRARWATVAGADVSGPCLLLVGTVRSEIAVSRIPDKGAKPPTGRPECHHRASASRAAPRPARARPAVWWGVGTASGNRYPANWGDGTMGLAENRIAGAEAIEVALQCTPKGSSNKGGKIVLKEGKPHPHSIEGRLPSRKKIPSIKDSRDYRAEITQDWSKSFQAGGTVEQLTKIMHRATAARITGMGNCVEQASIAFVYLYQKGVRPLDFMKFSAKGFDHGWLVIGRDANASEDLSTWGADAVWCDPWGADNGLLFSVAALVNGTANVEDIHYFRYAVNCKEAGIRYINALSLKQIVTKGKPELIYRAGA